jgi:hypothetical protein
MKWKLRNLACVMAVSALVVACGGNNTPAPPPPAQYPNPGTPGVPGYGVASCGGVGGAQPVRPDGSPYIGDLGQGNSIQLTLFLSTAYNADYSVKNVVGSANFTFPQLQQVIYPATTTQTSFCVSSANIQGGPPSPGKLYGNGALSMTLTGIIQTSYINPFQPGFPGGSG